MDNLHIMYVPVEDLDPADYNPRTWDTTMEKQLTERRSLQMEHCEAGRAISTILVVYVSISDITKEKELNLRLSGKSGVLGFELLKHLMSRCFLILDSMIKTSLLSGTTFFRLRMISLIQRRLLRKSKSRKRDQVTSINCGSHSKNNLVTLCRTVSQNAHVLAEGEGFARYHASFFAAQKASRPSGLGHSWTNI